MPLATGVNSPLAAKANKSIKYTADKDEIDPNVGFMVDVAGTLSYRLRADTALKQTEVQVGEYYPFDIAQFDLDLSEASQAITVFFRVS